MLCCFEGKTYICVNSNSLTNPCSPNEALKQDKSMTEIIRFLNHKCVVTKTTTGSNQATTLWIMGQRRKNVLLLMLLTFLMMPSPISAQDKPTTKTEKTDESAKKENAPTDAPEDTTKTSLKDRIMEKKEQIIQNIQEKIDSLKPKAEEAMIKADSVLSVRNAKITTDTLYVARPLETWTFRFKTDGFGEIMNLRAANPDGTRSNYYLTADPKVTLGIMANYRGISLSFSLSPSKILSDISDMMSAINYYSNTFGIDATFEKVESFHGRTGLQTHSHKLVGTDMRQFALTGYYVFNGKKFSLPAVFNSTWVQKRSAGSFLVQANLNIGRIRIGDNLDSEHSFTSQLNRINMNSLAIGAGYGYNLVAGKHWLLHGTFQPCLTIWQNYKLHTTADGKEDVNKMDNGNINFFLVGRLGAIYSWDKYFIGLTSVMQHSKSGKDSDFSVRDTQWQARAFFGWRIHTKLHERPKPVKKRRAIRRATTTRTTTAKPAATTKKATTTAKKPISTTTKKPTTTTKKSSTVPTKPHGTSASRSSRSIPAQSIKTQ